MDALSDVLRAVRLTGAIFFDVQASTPWVAATPAGTKIVTKIFPDADHLIPYHVVTHGDCWASVPGEPPVHLGSGDIVAFPHGDAHTMSSAPGMRGEADLSLYRRAAATDAQLPFAVSMGPSAGGPAPAHIVCGYLGCDARPFNPLLAALPPVIHVKADGGGGIGAFVQLAMAEARQRRAGSEAVLGHLSELMFVDIVRRFLETLPPDRTGWLAALREPFVGRALTALHEKPARAWTLESLAREVGLSRSALAERFTHYVGQPPMQYLTNWRLQLAATRLRSGTEGIAVIAEQVGYESEAAFSRAFRRVVGVPPGVWRRQRA